MRTFSVAICKVRMAEVPLASQTDWLRQLTFALLATMALVNGAMAQERLTGHPVPPMPIGDGHDDSNQFGTPAGTQSLKAQDMGPQVAVNALSEVKGEKGARPTTPPGTPKTPETAADAALAMATMLDGAGGGISGDELLLALQGAADAGQPMALWRLGVMYENGEGVKKDQAQAFRYFSRIANEHANTPPRSLEADIVAQSFLKIGQYYREGLPGAGIKADANRSVALVLHAASYFGDPDAQYQVGQMYLSKDSSEYNVLQAARWLSLAARKGHLAAQATLGDLLFNGNGIQAQPIEGLMWLNVAHDHAMGTPEQDWVDGLLSKAMSVATPEEREAAIKAAAAISPHLHG